MELSKRARLDCNNCPMPPAKKCYPYAATKIWTELVRSFRIHMCCKRHRRNFRTYIDCFTASGAVDVLHEILKANSHFSFTVTRNHAVKLMRKFLKKHVIEDISGRWGTEDLTDGNNLYRFPCEARSQDHVTVVAPAKKNHAVRLLIAKNKIPSSGRVFKMCSPPVIKRYSVIHEEKKNVSQRSFRKRSKLEKKLFPF